MAEANLARWRRESVPVGLTTGRGFSDWGEFPCKTLQFLAFWAPARAGQKSPFPRGQNGEKRTMAGHSDGIQPHPVPAICLAHHAWEAAVRCRNSPYSPSLVLFWSSCVWGVS